MGASFAALSLAVMLAPSVALATSGDELYLIPQDVPLSSTLPTFSVTSFDQPSLVQTTVETVFDATQSANVPSATNIGAAQPDVSSDSSLVPVTTIRIVAPPYVPVSDTTDLSTLLSSALTPSSSLLTMNVPEPTAEPIATSAASRLASSVVASDFSTTAAYPAVTVTVPLLPGTVFSTTTASSSVLTSTANITSAPSSPVSVVTLRAANSTLTAIPSSASSVVVASAIPAPSSNVTLLQIPPVYGIATVITTLVTEPTLASSTVSLPSANTSLPTLPMYPLQNGTLPPFYLPPTLSALPSRLSTQSKSRTASIPQYGYANTTATIRPTTSAHFPNAPMLTSIAPPSYGNVSSTSPSFVVSAPRLSSSGGRVTTIPIYTSIPAYVPSAPPSSSSRVSLTIPRYGNSSIPKMPSTIPSFVPSAPLFTSSKPIPIPPVYEPSTMTHPTSVASTSTMPKPVITITFFTPKQPEPTLTTTSVSSSVIIIVSSSVMSSIQSTKNVSTTAPQSELTSTVSLGSASSKPTSSFVPSLPPYSQPPYSHPPANTITSSSVVISSSESRVILSSSTSITPSAPLSIKSTSIATPPLRVTTIELPPAVETCSCTITNVVTTVVTNIHPATTVTVVVTPSVPHYTAAASTIITATRSPSARHSSHVNNGTYTSAPTGSMQYRGNASIMAASAYSFVPLLVLALILLACA